MSGRVNIVGHAGSTSIVLFSQEKLLRWTEIHTHTYPGIKLIKLRTYRASHWQLLKAKDFWWCYRLLLITFSSFSSLRLSIILLLIAKRLAVEIPITGNWRKHKFQQGKLVKKEAISCCVKNVYTFGDSELGCLEEFTIFKSLSCKKNLWKQFIILSKQHNEILKNTL